MSDALDPLLTRRLASVVRDRLADEPVIALQGPRSVGKSTLLSALAAETGAALYDLDDLSVREAVAADPGLFVSGPSPVYIDEYQHVPLLLDAIKAELNVDTRPGRFVITGSTRYEALPMAAQALTGRLHRINVLPFSQGEIGRTPEDFVERSLFDPDSLVTVQLSETTRDEYIARVAAGGFPLALQRREGTPRNRWFDDYITQSIERDVNALAKVRQQEVLPRLLSRLAGQTAQVLNIAKIGGALGSNRRTTEAYIKLLESVFLVQRLPSWGKTLTSRSTSAPKLHVMDSGLAARILRLSPAKLAERSPAAISEFGHLLETFVVGELLKQASWSDSVSGFGHWRTSDGDEVDLILERDDGSIVGFEVKSGGRVQGKDLKGLAKLRKGVGDQFLAGFAFYTGSRSYTFDDNIHVVPVDRLWN